MKNSECDHFEYSIKVDGKLIALINAPLKLRNPLQVKIENYPSQKKIDIVAESSLLAKKMVFSVNNAAGKQLYRCEKKSGIVSVAYASGLPYRHLDLFILRSDTGHARVLPQKRHIEGCV